MSRGSICLEDHRCITEEGKDAEHGLHPQLYVQLAAVTKLPHVPLCTAAHGPSVCVATFLSVQPLPEMIKGT